VSVAPLLIAPLTQWLISRFEWRVTLLFISAIYLQGTVIGCLMRPAIIQRKVAIDRTIDDKSGQSMKDGDNKPQLYQGSSPIMLLF